MKPLKKQLQANIWKFHLFQILHSLFFAVPIIVLFWQENGLSLTEVMILQSIFAVIVVLLEVPTGYFADVFGRKKSLIYTSFFTFSGLLAYSLGYSFTHFLIAEILWAFGVSFLSGADSALVYDTLVDLKQQQHYPKIWGKAIFYGLITLALSNIAGGFIGSVNFRYTFYLMLPFFATLIPLSFSFQEPHQHKNIIKQGYLLELFKTLKFSLIINKKLRWLLIYAGIIFAFNQAALWLYQPYFKLSGLDVIHFGIVFALFQIVAAISSQYSYKVEEKIGQRYSLILLVVLIAGSYLLMSNFIYLFSFSFAFIQQFVRGFEKVVINDYINKLTTSNRATILSAQSMIGRLLYAIILPFIGWAADAYSIIQALTILGITTIIIGTSILYILHRSNTI